MLVVEPLYFPPTENSQSDFVQFQAASTIHDAVLREWAILPPEEKEALRNYVIQYLTAQPALATYVISGLLHTFSVMVKRATLEDDRKKLFDSVFSTVTQLLAVNDTRMVRSIMTFVFVSHTHTLLLILNLCHC